MRILQDEGRYTIFQPEDSLSNQLQLMEEFGRTCYQSYKCKLCDGEGRIGKGYKNPLTLSSKHFGASVANCEACDGTGKRPITDESAEKFFKMIEKRGHESVFEHIPIVFQFTVPWVEWDASGATCLARTWFEQCFCYEMAIAHNHAVGFQWTESQGPDNTAQHMVRNYTISMNLRTLRDWVRAPIDNDIARVIFGHVMKECPTMVEDILPDMKQIGGSAMTLYNMEQQGTTYRLVSQSEVATWPQFLRETHSYMTVRFSDVSRGFCYDDQTEVLTKDGWKLFKDTTNSDEFLTLNMEYNWIDYQKREDYTCESWDGELLYAQSTMVDMAVTPNHRMLHYPYDVRKNKHWKIRPAKDIYGKRVKFLRGLLPGTRVLDESSRELTAKIAQAMGLTYGDVTESLLFWLYGIWMADGGIEWPDNKHGGQIRIAQTKPITRAVLENNLDMLGVEYSKFSWGVTIYGNNRVSLFRELFGDDVCKDKTFKARIPREIMDAPIALLMAFLEGIVAGDGNIHKKNGHIVVYTASERLAGDLQEAFMRVGWCATVRTSDRIGESHIIEKTGQEITTKSLQYIVSVTKRTSEHLFNRKHWSKTHYKGNVYCVTVPNGILYVRRNGKACWSGNTHELVRHRLCAFSQESTRYVDEKESSIVAPPKQNIDEGQGIGQHLTHPSFRQLTKESFHAYKTLRERGWAKEDARQALPIGLANEIVCTANLKEWQHIFKMRTAKPAHWEIRGVMTQVLEECKVLYPGVFDEFKLAGEGTKGYPYYEYIKDNS